MTATLHLAPIGQDKTEHALQLLRQLASQRRPAFPKAWVLLATRRQELSFRQRLIEADSSIPVYFNIEFFNFYTLNTRLLKIAGTPVRRLNSLTRHNFLRSLLAEMLAQGQLNTFHRIAETHGLVSVLADLIDELKQNSIDVDDFSAAARSAKDKEIAAIYRRYQDSLRRSELADLEGEGWLALATLRKRTDIAADVDLLLVDGYDQFTPVQAQLLAELSRSIKQVDITLTALPAEQAETLPSRSVLARNGLIDAYEKAGIDLNLRPVADLPGKRQRDLEQLGQKIFRHLPAEGSSDAIQLIAMPDPSEEVKAVLRAVKRLLLEGALADDILIALRDWERYATYFESGRQEYALPLLLHYERPYHRAPVIATLIDLLQLAPRFRRRDLLDSLRSPYIAAGLNPELIDLLDRISMEQQFLGGTEADWLEIIRLARQRKPDASGDSELTSLTAEQADRLSKQLSAFIRAVTPPESADLRATIRWLWGLLGADPLSDADDSESSAYSLNIIMKAWEHDRANPEIVGRDINALNGLKDILRDLLASDDILRATFKQNNHVQWQQFRSDLKLALETTADQRLNQARTGKVLVTTATEARGLPHEHVFILGLAEGVFPAEASEDPLYLDSERERLQTRGIPLSTRAERIDDRGLFYELVSLPRQTLTLSRPTYQSGRVWIASYLWRAVKQVFKALPLSTRAVGAVIHPCESANSSELMLAVADQLNQQDAAAAEKALGARNWLLGASSCAAQWRQLEFGRGVELGRLSNAPFDRYSGILSQPDLLRETARSLGEERVWSASRLKDYGLCGFRYFAKRLLKLEEVAEPEAGADALQIGLLNHSILEETYRRIGARGLAITEENLAEALQIFADVSADLLESAPDEFNFRATATWHEEKQVVFNRLAALIKQDFSPKSPLNRFGKTRTVHQLERYIDEVLIDLTDGMGRLRVNGYIDRIDLADGKLIVVDYKSGSTTIERREMEIGRDFQMMIYLLALKSMLEAEQSSAQVAGGLFWHLSNLRASGVHSSTDEDDIAAVEMARAEIAQNLKMGRAGQFPVHATKMESGKCSRYCEFSRFCRMHVTGAYKAVPRLAATDEAQ